MIERELPLQPIRVASVFADKDKDDFDDGDTSLLEKEKVVRKLLKFMFSLCTKLLPFHYSVVTFMCQKVCRSKFFCILLTHKLVRNSFSGMLCLYVFIVLLAEKLAKM